MAWPATVISAPFQPKSGAVNYMLIRSNVTHNGPQKVAFQKRLLRTPKQVECPELAKQYRVARPYWFRDLR